MKPSPPIFELGSVQTACVARASRLWREEFDARDTDARSSWRGVAPGGRAFALVYIASRLSQGAKKENRRNREDFIEVDTRDAAFGSPAPGVCCVFDEEIDVRLVQLRLESTPLAI